MGREGHRDFKSSASLSGTGGGYQMAYSIVVFFFLIYILLYNCYFCICSIFNKNNF